MSALRLMRRDELLTKRSELELTLGSDWRDTLLLQMAEQIARLTRKVSDLEAREQI